MKGFAFLKTDGQFRLALVACHMGPRLFQSSYSAVVVMGPILKVNLSVRYDYWSSSH